jgi:hypothetical protein
MYGPARPALKLSVFEARPPWPKPAPPPALFGIIYQQAVVGNQARKQLARQPSFFKVSCDEVSEGPLRGTYVRRTQVKLQFCQNKLLLQHAKTSPGTFHLFTKTPLSCGSRFKGVRTEDMPPVLRRTCAAFRTSSGVAGVPAASGHERATTTRCPRTTTAGGPSRTAAAARSPGAGAGPAPINDATHCGDGARLHRRSTRSGTYHPGVPA